VFGKSEKSTHQAESTKIDHQAVSNRQLITPKNPAGIPPYNNLNNPINPNPITLITPVRPT